METANDPIQDALMELCQRQLKIVELMGSIRDQLKENLEVQKANLHGLEKANSDLMVLGETARRIARKQRNFINERKKLKADVLKLSATILRDLPTHRKGRKRK